MEIKDVLNVRKWLWCGSNMYGIGHPEGLHTFSVITNIDGPRTFASLLSVDRTVKSCFSMAR